MQASVSISAFVFDVICFGRFVSITQFKGFCHVKSKTPWLLCMQKGLASWNLSVTGIPCLIMKLEIQFKLFEVANVVAVYMHHALRDLHCPPPRSVDIYSWLDVSTFILTPPEAIAPPEVYIGNRLQHQYAGIWSVSIGIHHEQCSCSVLNNEILPFESFIGYI